MKRIATILALLLLAAPAFGQAIGQLPAGNVWGNPTASRGVAQPTSITSILDRALCSAQGNVVARGASAWTCSVSPVLGLPGSTQGSLGFAGATSGTATIKAQAAAGTPTLTFPNTSGTFAVGVASPLTLSATTGQIGWSGTSGGIPYFSSGTAVASSGALTANALVFGGGAGAAPSTPVGLGTTSTVLHGNAAGFPSFGAVTTADAPTLAPLASPAFTGTPTAPTPSTTDNSTKIATTALVASKLSAYTLRLPNPTNLYVATTGSDSNDCLSLATPCLTIQHAVNLLYVVYDGGGSSSTINVGAGTFCGVVVSYPLPGGTYILIKGNGSSSTIIQACSAGGSGVTANAKATIYLQDLQLSGGGQTGSNDLLIEYFSFVGLMGQINFAAADHALIDALDHAVFNANSQPIVISGGAQYGFLISTQSAVVTGVGVTNVITGTPNFSVAFIDAIDGSFFNMGISSSWSGSATGVRYDLALNSYIDTEQITTPLPGSLPGTISNASRYYTNTGLACIGGVGGCANINVPTGLGTGGTASIVAGSGDTAGEVILSPGTGAASNGFVYVNLNSKLAGSLGQAGFCVVGLANSGSAWPTGSNVQSFYSGVSTGGQILIRWDSNGSALVSAASYGINWKCE
jgi:hypothetical protein